MSSVTRIRAAAGWAMFVGVIGVLALAGAVTLKPGLLGIPYNQVIVSGDSMLPTYETGDLVVTRRQESYRRGAIVAYRAPAESSRGPLIIHRIVAGDARRGYIFRGDNRTTRDPWQVKPEDVLGEASLRVPKVGLVFAVLRQPAGFAVLAAIVSLFFFLSRARENVDYSSDGRIENAARKSATSPSTQSERHQLQPCTARTPTSRSPAAQSAKPSSSTSNTSPAVPSSSPPLRKTSLPSTASSSGQTRTSDSAIGAAANATRCRARR